MDELFGAIAEGAVEFASSGSSGYGSRGRPEDQRIPCSLTCFGKWDIIQEVCMLVACIAPTITAALTLAAVSDVEEYAESNGGRLHVNPNIRRLDGSTGESFDADGSRGAAGYLIFICCTGIVFHLVSIFIQVYYIHADTTKQMYIYFIFVNLFIVLFGICFFAGAVANLIYFVDSNSFSRDCTPDFVGRELCQDLDRLAGFQMACFVLSIFTSVLYPFLWLPICLAICRKRQDDNDNRTAASYLRTSARPAPNYEHSSNTSTAVHVPPRAQENISTPSNVSTNGVPFISKYASPSVSKDSPSYTSTVNISTEPPSYETTIADTVEQ